MTKWLRLGELSNRSRLRMIQDLMDFMIYFRMQLHFYIDLCGQYIYMCSFMNLNEKSMEIYFWLTD